MSVQSACPHGVQRACCPYCYCYPLPVNTTTTTDSTTNASATSGIAWHISPPGNYGLRTYRCAPCPTEWWGYDYCPDCNPKPASAPESAEGEEHMSLIDERQIALLDKARAAKDEAHRYFKSKNDKARLMEIQLEALRKEAAEGIAELNEDFPLPDDE